jgi:hypothetical protein
MVFYSKGILLGLLLGVSALTAEANVPNLEADLVHYNISKLNVTVYSSDKYEPSVKLTLKMSGEKLAEHLEEKYGLEKGTLTDLSIPYSRLYISGDRDIFVRKTNNNDIHVTVMKQGTQGMHVI